MLNFGADDYVIKPCSIKEIVFRIQKNIQRIEIESEKTRLENIISQRTEHLSEEIEKRKKLKKDLEELNKKLIEVTEDRKKRESPLMKLSKRNSMILDKALNGFVLVDSNLNIIEINKRASVFIGYRKEKIYGRVFSDFIAEESRESWEKHIKKVISNKSDYAEIILQCKDINKHTGLNTNLIEIDGEKSFSLFFVDTTERKQWEKKLKAKETELLAKEKQLEEANIAMRFLLKQINEEKHELEKKMALDIENIIIPQVENLKKLITEKETLNILQSIESNLTTFILSLPSLLLTEKANLTPKELQIANYIRQGKTTKEISELMFLSEKTIETHRANIRKKLGLTNKKENLSSYLMSIR